MPDPLPSLGSGTIGPPPPGDFVESAVWSAERFLASHVDAATVARVTRAALSFPVPLVEVEPGIHVLELHHGPSHAFKDVGARFMANLMSEHDDSDATSAQRTVLVATSGDTGGAVASAFHGLERYRVVALFPREGISKRQRRQMTTLGDNVSAVAVAGTFDDCQRMAKQAFGQPRMRERHRLTSANSINVGRLLPQSFYYLHAWILLAGAPARFVVPSGNLGNLCAGLVASLAGMPCLGFLAASNTNDVFPQYLNTGSFQPGASLPTISNAMDVGAPSNFERIQWLFRDDPGALQRTVSGTSIGDAETAECIADVYRRTGYVLDPHSAVAYRAQERHPGVGDSPTVVLATAHPAKFPDVVEKAIGRAVELPEGLAQVMDAEEHFSHIDPTLDALEAFLDRE
jgi:threonine synthase